MYKYIEGWTEKQNSSANRKTWNSAKVSNLKIDFLQKRNYIKKIILFVVGALICLLALIKKFKSFEAFIKFFK